MPSSSPRRSFLKGSLAALSVSVAGCSAVGDETDGDPEWASSSDLAVYNETGSSHRIEIALFETTDNPDSTALPYTLKEESTPPAGQQVFGRELAVSADGDEWVENVLTKPEDETVYRLIVRVESGEAASYAFATEYGSGLTLLSVNLLSPSEVTFSQLTV
jgi:hypothetical protein